MDFEKLRIGGVYQTYVLGGKNLNERFYDSPSRILAFDRSEVFYDAWWETAPPGWGLSAKSNRPCTYYRMATKTFLSQVRYLRYEPLDPSEFRVFRPDLPLRICRRQILPLEKFYEKSYEKFFLNLSASFLAKMNREKLKAAEIIIRAEELNPKSAFGGRPAKPFARVKPQNGKFFNGTELLWHAAVLTKKLSRPSRGIGFGLYRSGHEKKIPVYTIGGYLRYWNKEYQTGRD